MSSEILLFSTSSLAFSFPEHEKDTLSIVPHFAPLVYEEEERMTSGEIGLEHGKDLSPAEQVFTPLTPPPEYEEDISDSASWASAFLPSPPVPSLTGLEHDFYFPPTFKKYIQGELKWSRLAISDELCGYDDLDFWVNDESKGIRWVFWSRQDDDRPPSDDSFMDLTPDVRASTKVRDNIRHAVEEMILNTILGNSLVQFWAPIKTSEGRTLLSTRYQPFALGKTHNKIDRQHLCDYWMMCREYKFNADAESGEDQLGLPGRVFLHQFPESTPYVSYYSTKEYPQLLDALECSIKGSWALPVFECSSQTCVGVLEIASLLNMPSVWLEKSFLGHLCDIFQDFGLRIFDGYRHLEMQSRYKNEASTAAFQELEMVCQSVCKIHNLPLALTWVSCSSCNDLLRSQHQFGDRDYFDYSNLFDFMEVSREYYLRKGMVTGRILTSPNLLYCSDVKQFSITEYPLVPYARRCKLSGWFTMCLRSSYTGNEFYVLEFFLPRSSKCNETVMTTISFILGTMEENFRTFKLASGQELGEVLSVEVLDFQNVQKSPSVQMIKATRCIPSLEPLKVEGVVLQLGHLDQSSMDAINNGMNVVTEALTDNLPSLEPLQNGKVAMQLDSTDQQSMDPSNNGQNVGTMERNIIEVSSPEEGTRNTQEKEHKKAGVRIEVSFEDVLKCTKMSFNKAVRKLKVSRSRLKRICRGYGIYRWPPCKINMVRKICRGYGIYRWLPRKINMVCYSRLLPDEDHEQIPKLPSEQASSSVGNIKPVLQDANMVTIKAKYETYTLKFRLPLSSRLEDLKQEVAKRLNFGARTYNIQYKDEEDELILIACDQDLQDCIHSPRSLDNSTIVVLLELEQPITNLNPTD